VAMCENLVVSSPNYSFFCLPLDVFPTPLCIRLGLSHPLVLGVSHYIYSQHLDPMGIHLFYCMHGGENMALHDVQNAFTAIVRDAKFNVLRRESHVLPPPTL
jgi:hypothetical protein